MDGVLAKLVLDCTKDESPDKHWVMFDGPVDALWIENMTLCSMTTRSCA